MRKYGMDWPAKTDALIIERNMIRSGGTFTLGGQVLGEGLLFHFKAMQSLLWPWLEHHRWSDLILSTILAERITVIAGAKDSGKTNTVSAYALCDYFCFPQETLIMMSSTDTRGLEMRVWGQVKSMFQEAKERYPFLEGNVVDSKHSIFTDRLGENAEVRDMRKGVVGIPCLSGQGQWIGMEKFVGIKQKRRRLIGDEVQFMKLNYLKSLDNLDKGDFKGVFCGNPIGQNDPLDVVSEPVNGWDSLTEVTKTGTWRNKYRGLTINLVGTDSPNFDKDRKKDLPFLINQTDVDRIGERRGKDSAEFYSQILGIRKVGLNAHRVLTKEMCRNNGAFGDVFWEGSGTTTILGLDAGFGGDDCELEMIKYGRAVGGQMVIKFHPTVLVPVSLSATDSPEIQIASFVKKFCKVENVEYQHIYFDAGMWATLAVEMALQMSAEVNAVNFGGTATDRPVNNDLFIIDPITHDRRLKRCDEHYSKFVTELWFSIRELVDSKQARTLPEDMAEEFGMREWYWVSGDRYELETKQECKERMGHSPNKADAGVIALEGARREGFIIERMRVEKPPPKGGDWLSKEVDKYRERMKHRELTYV